MLLETERCLIRNFTAADIVPLMHYRNNEHWMRFQGFKGLTREAYKAALLNPQSEQEGMQLAVVRKADGRLLGDLYLKAVADAHAIGYTLDPSFTHQGYAREAVSALIHWLKSRQCQVVRACVMPENTASVALLQKLGFSAFGIDTQGDLVFELHLL